MKKLIAILSLALFVNLTIAKAQTANVPATDTKKSEAVAKDACKQSKSAASCAKSCSDDKAQAASTTTLSENYANAGSAPEATVKTDKAACAPGQSKSCCKSNNKASAITKDLKQANTSNAIAPKEVEAPKQ